MEEVIWLEAIQNAGALLPKRKNCGAQSAYRRYGFVLPKRCRNEGKTIAHKNKKRAYLNMAKTILRKWGPTQRYGATTPYKRLAVGKTLAQGGIYLRLASEIPKGGYT